MRAIATHYLRIVDCAKFKHEFILVLSIRIFYKNKLISIRKGIYNRIGLNFFCSVNFWNRDHSGRKIILFKTVRDRRDKTNVAPPPRSYLHYNTTCVLLIVYCSIMLIITRTWIYDSVTFAVSYRCTCYWVMSYWKWLVRSHAYVRGVINKSIDLSYRYHGTSTMLAGLCKQEEKQIRSARKKIYFFYFTMILIVLPKQKRIRYSNFFQGFCT